MHNEKKRTVEKRQPYSCKNWKSEFSKSSAGGFTSEKVWSSMVLERSSTE